MNVTMPIAKARAYYEYCCKYMWKMISFKNCCFCLKEEQIKIHSTIDVECLEIGKKLIAVVIQFRMPETMFVENSWLTLKKNSQLKTLFACFNVQLIWCEMLYGKHRKVVHRGLSVCEDYYESKLIRFQWN